MCMPTRVGLLHLAAQAQSHDADDGLQYILEICLQSMRRCLFCVYA